MLFCLLHLVCPVVLHLSNCHLFDIYTSLILIMIVFSSMRFTSLHGLNLSMSVMVPVWCHIMIIAHVWCIFPSEGYPGQSLDVGALGRLMIWHCIHLIIWSALKLVFLNFFDLRGGGGRWAFLSARAQIAGNFWKNSSACGKRMYDYSGDVLVSLTHWRPSQLHGWPTH
jgi:hypothetical protein